MFGTKTGRPQALLTTASLRAASGPGTLGSLNYAARFTAGTLTVLPASSSSAAVPERGQATPLTLCGAGVLYENACRNYVNPINRDMAFVAFAP